MKILSVVGARPNFMKIAPFIRAIESHNAKLLTLNSEQFTQNLKDLPTPIPSREGIYLNGTRTPELATSNIKKIDHILVHTGQHYDENMSKAFFDDLNIPETNINLGVGSGTHAEQVGQTMIAFEKVLRSEKPDWVVVVGDVNATLACSVTAKKECVKCCHIEAGLRSGDLTMPEEINRLVTDRISDLLLAPDRLAIENLKAEGVPDSKIRFVGNIMIDTLEANRAKASRLDINEIINRNLINFQAGVGYEVRGTRLEECETQNDKHGTRNTENLPTPGPSREGSLSDATRHKEHGTWNLKHGTSPFAVLTIHRPSNVDVKEVFEPIVRFLKEEVTRDMILLWPVHPRARKQLMEFGLWEKVAGHESIILLEPLGYLDMLRLNMEARVILTDSGGLQEECTVLGTPCLTLRWNTERPVTLRDHGGASVLVGNNIEKIREAYHAALHHPRNPVRPELWDGHTAERCLQAILGYGKA